MGVVTLDKPAPIVASVVPWLLAITATGAAVVAAGLVLRVPGYWPALTTPASLTLVLVPGIALTVAGLIASTRPMGRDGAAAGPVGILFGAAGVLWFIAAWNDPAATSWAFTLGRLSTGTCAVLAVHGALWCQGPRRRLDAVGLGLGYLCAVVLSGLLPVLLDDPSTTVCTECPGDPLLLAHEPAVASGLARLAVWGSLVWSSLLIAGELARLLAWSSVRRRVDGPVALATIGVNLVVVISAVAALAWSMADTGALDGPLWVALAVTLTAVAAGSVWPVAALRLTRLRLARVSAESSANPTIGGLSGKLGTVLGDRSVRLLYPVADGQLVDAGGNLADPPASAMLTRLARGPVTVAYLAHDRSLAADRGRLVGEITQAARLVLDSERLRAEHTWHLNLLRESRRRIVATGDRARRELERNLHDGAQQNLVGLAMALSVATLQAASPSDAAILRQARTEVDAALAELRLVARGIFPRELADEGLAAALDLLAESAGDPVDIVVELPRRASADVEATAYFAIRSSLDSAAGGPATVTVRLESRPASDGSPAAEWLVADVRAASAPVDPQALGDRVGALGGHVQIEPATVGVWLRLELPCAS
jgi:signal transduction histidine kinase